MRLRLPAEQGQRAGGGGDRTRYGGHAKVGPRADLGDADRVGAATEEDRGLADAGLVEGQARRADPWGHELPRRGRSRVVAGAVDFFSTGVQQRHPPALGRAQRLGHRLQRRHAEAGSAGSEAQPAHGPQPDADPGKRARAPDRHVAVQTRLVPPGVIEQQLQPVQEMRRVRLLHAHSQLGCHARPVALGPLLDQRHAAPPGRSVQRDDPLQDL